MGRNPSDYEKKIYVRISDDLKDKIQQIIKKAKEHNKQGFKTEADLIRKILEKSTKSVNSEEKKSRIKVYNSEDDLPFDLSRSAVDLYIDCPRCFILHKKKAIPRPSGFPFTLNNAVDSQLKFEFDKYRKEQKSHPIYHAKLANEFGIDCMPFQNENLERWRNNFRGIEYVHKSLNFKLKGAVDDIWIDKNTKELIIVDYKATSTQQLAFDKPYHDSYRRQLEFYQYLFRKNDFKVSDTAFILYANAIKKSEFNETLNFEITLFSHNGNVDWVENVLMEIKNDLNSDIIPPASENCEYCKHAEKASYINLF